MAYYSEQINITDFRGLMLHQSETFEAMNNYFDLTGNQQGTQNGLVVMPTGSGKTFKVLIGLC
jgi:superfamily II DNA or RNA helicase